MITITDDRTQLDLAYIHAFITQSYWAPDRSPEEMQKAIDHSDPFGMYLDGKQIGFARVVSDRVQFAYLMDVFVDPAHQGKGYGYRLIRFILSYPAFEQVRIWRLATRDAHALYARCGFTPLQAPQNMMEYLPGN